MKTCFATFLSLVLMLAQTVFTADAAPASKQRNCCCPSGKGACCIKSSPCGAPEAPAPAQRQANATQKEAKAPEPSKPQFLFSIADAQPICDSFSVLPVTMQSAPIYALECVYLIGFFCIPARSVPMPGAFRTSPVVACLYPNETVL